MITKNMVIDILMDACPSYKSALLESKKHDSLYIIMGNLARHLIRQCMNSDNSELINVGIAIEKFHADGDAYVQELATIGILEGIQNNCRNSNIDSAIFIQFLGPESLKWWNSLNKFWNHEIKYVGQDIGKI